MNLRLRLVAVLIGACASTGCASVAVTLAGLGAGIGANHFIGNVTTRTFTHPQDDAKRATLAALKRMQMEVESIEATPRAGELIRGRTTGREIEIELEPVSPTVTRVRSVVRMEGSLTLDGATAAEIVAQTERGLAAMAVAVTPSTERMPEAPNARPAGTSSATALASVSPADGVRTRSTANAVSTPASRTTSPSTPAARAARAPAAAVPPQPPR